MTIPLIMLILMMAPALIAHAVSPAARRNFHVRNAAAIGLGILFVFTGIGHFVQTKSMAQMLPPWVPARTLLVYLTGGLEFIVAAGFFVPKFRRSTGWIAVVLLVIFFPVNVYAAVNHIPMGGHAWGPIYLLVRAPLQTAIFLWTYWFTIRQPNTALQPTLSTQGPGGQRG